MQYDYHNLKEDTLFQLVKANDELAYRELFDRYKELLFRHAYRMTQDSELSKDIVQDIFLVLWNKRASIEISQSLEPYLIKSIRNKIMDYFSHQEVVEKYREDILSFVEQGICYTDDLLLEKELAAMIEREKSKLSPRTREVFELNREQGRSYKEISALLSTSEKTIKNRYIMPYASCVRNLVLSFFSDHFFIFFILPLPVWPSLLLDSLLMAICLKNGERNTKRNIPEI
ncbi:sigma-70 family RNA polymerase sigma factor [Sphingobacterium sp. E70]|uniref:sigma-70 family RNA polymerase sigma factor n=1 Tax=Sphingobacterium sp. E70 TaxID=2853439 RepID=UPI00211B8745|nr:sigma-70 family RNA polymerase sigma factor [Sphingobacterium sp. E70]ULT23630.1 sigma-70 family RNA polymerase sigma factor [Sphingobacterium sp. E70]